MYVYIYMYINLILNFILKLFVDVDKVNSHDCYLWKIIFLCFGGEVIFYIIIFWSQFRTTPPGQCKVKCKNIPGLKGYINHHIKTVSPIKIIKPRLLKKNVNICKKYKEGMVTYMYML